MLIKVRYTLLYISHQQNEQLLQRVCQPARLYKRDIGSLRLECCSQKWWLEEDRAPTTMRC